MGGRQTMINGNLVVHNNVIAGIRAVIPATASEENKLATMADVGDSVSPTIRPNSGETYAQFLKRLFTSPTYDYTKQTNNTAVIINPGMPSGQIPVKKIKLNTTGYFLQADRSILSSGLIFENAVVGSTIVFKLYMLAYSYTGDKVYRLDYNDSTGAFTKTDLSSEVCAWTNAYIQY